MSHVALGWAWPQQGLDPTAKLLLIKLADQANDDGECWPSKRTLAAHVGVSARTIQRQIDSLAQAGMLIVEPRRTESGRSRSNLYRLALTEEIAVRATLVTREGDAGVVGEGDAGVAPVLRTEPTEGPSLAAARKRDVVWDVLAEHFGQPAPSERTDFGKTVAAIKTNLAPNDNPAAIDWSDDPDGWVRREIGARVEAMGDDPQYRSHRSLRTRWTALAPRDEGITMPTLPVHYGEVGSCEACTELWPDAPNSFDPACGICGGTGRQGYVL